MLAFVAHPRREFRIPLMMKSEIRDGMKSDLDAPNDRDVSVVLRCDLCHAIAAGKCPVNMSSERSVKSLKKEENYNSRIARIVQATPDGLEGSSNVHENCSLFVPEK